MSTLITSIEHSLATAASDTVKVAKFVETKVSGAEAGEGAIPEDVRFASGVLIG